MRAIDALLGPARARPEAPAFIVDGLTCTYGELLERSRRVAAGLAALGVGPGDRVAGLLPAGVELVVAMLAVWRLGAVHVPVNDRYGARELQHILDDSGARVVLLGAGTPVHAVMSQIRSETIEHRVILGGAGEGERAFEALEQAAPLEGEPAWSDDTPAWFLYTSGTTGASKGVVHTYGSLAAGIDALTRLWAWTPRDRLALALPLFHVHGLAIGVLGTLLRGSSAEILPFSPEGVVDAVARGASVFMGVPTMYHRLLAHLRAQPEHGASLGQARLFTSGSAALPAADFEAFERLTGHRILERYGMSETLLTLSNPYSPEQRVPGSVGFPIPGVQARLVDAEGAAVPPGELGEIQVRGAQLLREYWGLPEASAASRVDGWFRTGDLAVQDAEGRFYHRGRSGPDLIKSGGYRISAREIEEAILSHPEVAEVAVLGRPDAEWGQRIVAAIVPTAENSYTEDDWLVRLRGHLEGQLADYKRPREILIRSALPRNALGKIQKHRIL
ncbi:MAG: AMP-binding protein [Alphaproteobacteria bacterium]|nr:AMP-binding protein [Alphaproteobacteria bacterium]